MCLATVDLSQLLMQKVVFRLSVADQFGFFVGVRSSWIQRGDSAPYF